MRIRIWGGLLPFVGFRTERVTREMRAFLSLPPDCETLETFQLEWLGWALVVACRVAR